MAAVCAGAAGASAWLRSRLTARWALLAMLGLFFAGNLLAIGLHLGLLAGLSFAAGCVLAASHAPRHALLPVVIAPPLLFLVALLGAEVLTSPGSTFVASVEAVAEGSFLMLAGAAPWLFGSVIVALAVAMFRGLPQSLRELSADLRGRTGAASHRAPTRSRGL